MRDLSDFEKDLPLTRNKKKEEPPAAPKPPIGLRAFVGCSKCHTDFEWVGLAKDIEEKKTCPGCQRTENTW